MPTNRLSHRRADDDVHSDDRPVGSVLSRREVVATLGTAGLGLLFGCSSTSTSSTSTTSTSAPAGSAADASVAGCLVRPEQTEGPFFVDGTLERSDIRVDPLGGTSTGVPLSIALQTASVNQGRLHPLTDARIDMWHCNAQGHYSDPHDQSVPLSQSRFLRGYQTTDGDGLARFTTVYPGWYHGRTVHIHIKVRWLAGGNHREFTSQLYFPDSLSQTVFADAAYARAGKRDRLNQQDGIFTDGGDQLMLALAPQGAGYTARFGIAMIERADQR
jgi:protocatechuate 3,4-dioxygenase beta subunit